MRLLYFFVFAPDDTAANAGQTRNHSPWQSCKQGETGGKPQKTHSLQMQKCSPDLKGMHRIANLKAKRPLIKQVKGSTRKAPVSPRFFPPLHPTADDMGILLPPLSVLLKDALREYSHAEAPVEVYFPRAETIQAPEFKPFRIPDQNDKCKEDVTLFPRRKAGQASQDGGKGPVVLSVEVLRQYFGMPLHLAAKKLVRMNISSFVLYRQLLTRVALIRAFVRLQSKKFADDWELRNGRTRTPEFRRKRTILVDRAALRALTTRPRRLPLKAIANQISSRWISAHSYRSRRRMKPTRSLLSTRS